MSQPQDETGPDQSTGGGAGGDAGGAQGSTPPSAKREDGPSDWEKELAERRAAQLAKKQAAAGAAEEEEAEEDAGPEKRSTDTPDWEQGIMPADEELAIEAPNAGLKDTLAPITDASRTWAGYVGQADAAINTGATYWGETSAAITSFLAPVPAMLLVFLTLKVPIPIPIPVMYKPESLSWSKKAEWSAPIGSSSSSCSGKVAEQKTPMRNVPQATFKGGGPEELDIELFFDTTDTQLDVRLLIKPIQMLVYKVPLRNEPPLVMFSWGVILSKMSYIEELEIDYTMFRADGTPLRAEVNMTLTEYDISWMSALPMNPTSMSEARKTWVVTEGQTLDWIAYQEYGNSVHWRHIAQVNNLTNPRDLRSGQILKLTPLP